MRSVLSARSTVISSVLLSWLAVPLPALGEQGSPPASTRSISASDSLDQTQARQRRRRRRSASSSNVGYVDNAILGTQLQIRYDFANGADRPDRAEFIYGKCGCFREAGLDPDAPGPAPSFADIDPFTTPVIENDLTYHDVVLDAEYAFHDRFSVFAEVPFRILNLTILDNTSGIGDVRVGFKFAAVADSQRYLTLQLRAYLPTGDARDGLGTDHLSLEPALLYHEGRFGRLKLEGELRYWIPINGSTGLGAGMMYDADDDFSGGVFRYGVGVGYDVTPTSPVRFTPVVELVGWTVTGGIATTSTDGTLTGVGFEDASGTTLNVKVGVRLGVRRSDAIFVGYGRALTNDVWYQNIVRVEYRLVL